MFIRVLILAKGSDKSVLVADLFVYVLLYTGDCNVDNTYLPPVKDFYRIIIKSIIISSIIYTGGKLWIFIQQPFTERVL